MAQRMKDYIKLVGWIHLVSNFMAFTEFGGIQIFSNYVLLKPLVDSDLPADISDVCKIVENQNTTECQEYKVWIKNFMYVLKPISGFLRFINPISGSSSSQCKYSRAKKSNRIDYIHIYFHVWSIFRYYRQENYDAILYACNFYQEFFGKPIALYSVVPSCVCFSKIDKVTVRRLS